MHTGPMPDSAGTFGDWIKSQHPHSCGSAEHFYRVWESHCGGYEDEKHECRGCGATWWVEGSDS